VVTLQYSYICLAEQLVILITHTRLRFMQYRHALTSPLYLQPLSCSWLIFVMG
jgi:hypothetical protein